MAIVTFRSNELKETGQTLSLVATAAQMAIEHSYKILIKLFLGTRQTK